MAFEWRGKDRRGVTLWEGDRNNVSHPFEMILFGVSLILCVVGIMMMFDPKPETGRADALFGGAVLETGALIFGGMARLHCLLRKRIELLETGAELAERLRMTSAEVFALATEKGIKPVYCINGVDCYDPSAFTQAGVLLRPALSPDDDLLRVPETLPAHTDLLCASSDQDEGSCPSSYHSQKKKKTKLNARVRPVATQFLNQDKVALVRH